MIFVLIIPFILTLNLLPNDPRNPLVDGAVVHPVPLPDGDAGPVRARRGPLWEVLVAALIALVAIVVVVRVAGRVYSNSILRTGARVSLREALRG